jgi:hypothetical protein
MTRIPTGLLTVISTCPRLPPILLLLDLSFLLRQHIVIQGGLSPVYNRCQSHTFQALQHNHFVAIAESKYYYYLLLCSTPSVFVGPETCLSIQA